MLENDTVIQKDTSQQKLLLPESVMDSLPQVAPHQDTLEQVLPPDLKPKIITFQQAETPSQSPKTVVTTNALATDTLATDTLVGKKERFQCVMLQKDSSIVNSSVADFPGWAIPPGFGGHFSPDNGQSFTLKEMYPGENGIFINRGIQSEIWFTPLLFLLFLSYVSAFFQKKRHLLQNFKEVFFFTFRSETSRGEIFADNFQSKFLLIVTGIVNISLFLFFSISDLQQYSPKSFTLVLSFFGVFTLLYVLFKTAMIKLICYVFFDKNLSLEWTKTFNLLIVFSGIVLIPIILCFAYGPTSWMTPVVYIGIFLCAVLSFLYLSKVTIFFFGRASSLFYLILYLCSLEILPACIFFLGLISVITNNGIIGIT